jgi:integrase
VPDYELKEYRGKWCVQWWSGGKRYRRSLGTSDRAAAERAYAEFTRQVATPAHITVNWLWDAYLQEKDGKPAVKRMRSEWKALGPVFGNLHPHQITVAHCRQYVAERRLKGLKQGTIWTELGDLQIVLNWAAKRDHIAKPPRLERPSKPSPRDRYLTRDEAKLLIASATCPHVKLAIILMLSTAARVGAILELTWKRVDFVRGVVVLRVDEEGTDGNVRRKGRAIVPMTSSARAALLEAHKGALSDHVIEYDAEPVKSIKRSFAATVERSGLKDVTPHVLRHTAAVWMAEAGRPMAEIAQYLGHEDSRITERVYARFSPDHLRQTASALELDL